MCRSRQITDRDAALRFLFGRIDYERAPTIPYQAKHLKLERMEVLLSRLGSPHQGMDIVHVAGSKGKGSTAVMIASVLAAAGFRTGLYTSPHLERLEERIVVNGVECSAADLVALVDRIRPEVEAMDQQHHGSSEENGPTYFEITTALAYLYFRRQQTDVAVLEVGLGGRLDSTNVCQPNVSVITSISLDHTKQLGNTVAEIAAEKAGIIKPGVPVVSGVRHGPARQVIQQRARHHGCPLATLGVDFDFQYHPPRIPPPGTAGLARPTGRLDYRSSNGQETIIFEDMELGLPGRHQAANAAVTLAVVEQLRRQSWEISERALRQGLAAAHCPARVEVLARQPIVILDGAHNVASVQALLDTIDQMHSGGHRTLVFATTRGKDAEGMLRELLPRFDRVIFTCYQMNPRSEDPDRLLQLARQIGKCPQPAGNWPRVQVCPEPGAAWDTARHGVAADDLLCVTGSFFLAAELRPRIAADRPI